MWVVWAGVAVVIVSGALLLRINKLAIAYGAYGEVAIEPLCSRDIAQL